MLARDTTFVVGISIFDGCQVIELLPSHFSDIPKNGDQHDDVSLGDPDDMVDEGNRWVCTCNGIPQSTIN